MGSSASTPFTTKNAVSGQEVLSGRNSMGIMTICPRAAQALAEKTMQAW
jgi:hypothetical protein